MTISMSATDYAKKIKDCSRQAVVRALKKNKLHLLPNVTGYTKVGSYYVLYVKQ